MNIFSWNVNGIRSAFQKGFLEWFTTTSPDILCLQEVRAHSPQYPAALQKLTGYSLHTAEADRKGYSGVATWSREKILDTNFLGKKIFDQEGRVLIHEFKNFFLINAYFPNGQRDHSRLDFKLQFCDVLLKKMIKLREQKPIILTGDINTAHRPIDLANPKGNKNTTGFLEVERAFLDKMLAAGFIDIFRHQHPHLAHQYTWWSNRPGCRERNIGWRIDAFYVDESIVKKVKNSAILSHVKGSDHCPILLEISI
jgi:exodeoxyribonuclease-3